MSVVNKMLNDLEKRDSAEGAQQANYVPPKKAAVGLSRIIIYTLLLVIVAGVCAYLFLSTNKQSTVSVKPKSQTVQSQVEQKQAAQTQIVQKKVTEHQANEQTAPAENANIASVTKHSSVVETQLEPNKAQPIPELRPADVRKPDTTDLPIPKAPVDKLHTPQTQQTEARLAITPSGGSKQSNFQSLVADALAKNDYATAKQVLAQWIEKQPEQLEARKKLASLWFAEGDLAAAEALLRDTQSRFPQNASVRLMQARLFNQKSDLESAWNVLQISSNNSDLLHLRASLARQLHKPEIAQQDYQAVIVQSPNDLKAWLGHAVVSESLGQTRIAIQGFQQVQRLAANNNEIQQYATARLRKLQEALSK